MSIGMRKSNAYCVTLVHMLTVVTFQMCLKLLFAT